ncbi:MAG: hypothetical protein QM736_08830 [Vicinamibacterales bacterium]
MLRTRPGRQTAFNGHCPLPRGVPNPHAFIIPRWQTEKLYFTGSAGSSARKPVVMSSAIRHPGLV